MSGHSKWSTIKRKKGAADAKRGKIFSKLAKEISIAARLGGGDADMNPRLRTVLLKARSENMPKDNIERAVQKGTGDLEGVAYEEIRYEGYGPAGVALIMDIVTDNKNRAVAEIRHVLTKHGGSMAENGAVTWNFDQRGSVVVKQEGLSDEEVFEKAIEAGAEDVNPEGEFCTVVTEPSELHAVSSALEEMGLQVEEASLTMMPKTTVQVTGKDAAAVMRIMDALEDLDDVQNVYSNFDIPEEEMAQLMEA